MFRLNSSYLVLFLLILAILIHLIFPTHCDNPQWDTTKTKQVKIKGNSLQILTEPLDTSKIQQNIHRMFEQSIVDFLDKTRKTPIGLVNLTVGRKRYQTSLTKPDKIDKKEGVVLKWIYTPRDSDGHSIPIAWAQYYTDSNMFITGILSNHIVVNLIEALENTGEISYIAEVWQYRDKEFGPQEGPERIRLPVTSSHANVSKEHFKRNKIKVTSKKKIRWVNPHFGLGPGINYRTLDGQIYPSIGLDGFLSGYGKTEHDQDIKFIGVSVGTGEQNGSIHFVPVGIRLSRYTPNTYGFVSIGASLSYGDLTVSPEISLGARLGF